MKMSLSFFVAIQDQPKLICWVMHIYTQLNLINLVGYFLIFFIFCVWKMLELVLYNLQVCTWKSLDHVLSLQMGGSYELRDLGDADREINT